jgi:hypothetical protein
MAVLLALPATTASAQYYGGYGGGGYYGWGGWGATPEGDIARGMGAYAQGVGVYNVTTAQANSINADTMMRWNSYLWSSQNSLNREHYQRMIHERERNKELLDQIATRIRENPNKGDIERGDALNSILEQLSDPRVHPSALRMARVPLNSKWIQEIPFHYASEAVTLSLHNMTSKDGWPLALRAEAFEPEREAYRRAIDSALEQDKEGEISPDTIRAVNDSVFRLKAKVETSIPKSSRDYVQAQNYLKSLAGMARMLSKPEIEQVLASLENYPGTTVADLLAFMQMFNLRFGAASTVRERAVYAGMYPLLDEQRDAILSKNRASEVPPAPTPGSPPTTIFHEMPWENLVGKTAPADPKPKKKDQNQ